MYVHRTKQMTPLKIWIQNVCEKLIENLLQCQFSNKYNFCNELFIWFLKSKYRHNNFTYSISRYLIGIYQMVILFFIFIWTWNGIVRYFPLISSPLCICGLPLQTQWAALLMAPLYIWDPCFSHSMTPVSWIVKNEHGILEKNKINGGNFLLVKLFIIPIMKFIIIPPRII